MTMKERVDKILGDFLKRDRNYAVEVYINNAVTNKRVGQMFITMDRIASQMTKNSESNGILAMI